jgi:tetratricopeptide (TPR) repeat protein
MSRRQSRRVSRAKSRTGTGVADPARLWQKAVKAYECGRPAEARSALKPLLEHPAADGYTFLLAGLVEARLADWPRAEAYLREAVKTVPERVEAWLTLGNALHALGRMEEAAAAMKSAAERAPGNAQAWNNLAVVNEDMGRLRDALDGYERALAIDPDFPQALRGRATVLAQLRWFEQAKGAYETLLARYPDAPDLRLEYARFLEQANRPEEAASYLPEPGSVADKATDAQIEYLRAQLLTRRGELEPALDGLGRARERTGEDFLSYREGIILDRLGRYDEAMAAFSRANQARARQKDFQRLLAQPVEEYLDHKLEADIQTLLDGDDGSGEDTRLVFVTGLPRSGTTLLDRMLNAHPEIQVLEELEGLRMAEGAFAEGASPGKPAASTGISSSATLSLRPAP